MYLYVGTCRMPTSFTKLMHLVGTLLLIPNATPNNPSYILCVYRLLDNTLPDLLLSSCRLQCRDPCTGSSVSTVQSYVLSVKGESAKEYRGRGVEIVLYLAASF